MSNILVYIIILLQASEVVALYLFQVPHKEVFMKELKASLNFFQMQKPVLRNPSRAQSITSQADIDEKDANRLNAVDNFINFEKN